MRNIAPPKVFIIPRSVVRAHPSPPQHNITLRITRIPSQWLPLHSGSSLLAQGERDRCRSEDAQEPGLSRFFKPQTAHYLMEDRMHTFQDRVAVITGAASGIGRGLARRCAHEGMKVVLADVEPAALAEAESELRSHGTPVLALVTDVSQALQMELLAQKTLDTFGAIHLLCNNAGVGLVRSVWESTLADWEWVLGVNLWGVIHGLRVFVPIMLKQDTEGHIVNTASISGLIVGPGSSSTYNVSKHGVVALSETLYYELAQRGAKVKVSVLLPCWVNTRIFDAERNRPVELRNDPLVLPVDPETDAVIEAGRQAAQQGMSPDQVAQLVFQAIESEQLYVFTHPETKEWVRIQMEHMLAERNPPVESD